MCFSLRLYPHFPPAFCCHTPRITRLVPATSRNGPPFSEYDGLDVGQMSAPLVSLGLCVGLGLGSAEGSESPPQRSGPAPDKGCRATETPKRA